MAGRVEAEDLPGRAGEVGVAAMVDYGHGPELPLSLVTADQSSRIRVHHGHLAAVVTKDHAVRGKGERRGIGVASNCLPPPDPPVGADSVLATVA